MGSPCQPFVRIELARSSTVPADARPDSVSVGVNSHGLATAGVFAATNPDKKTERGPVTVTTVYWVPSDTSSVPVDATSLVFATTLWSEPSYMGVVAS